MINQYLTITFVLLFFCFFFFEMNCVLTDPSRTVEMFNLTISKKSYLQQRRCQGFQVNANFRKLKLTFESENIDHLLVTNRLIKNCEQQQFSECDEKSNLQSHISAKTEFSIGKCMENFYIYAFINDFRGGSILAKVDENSGCDAIEEDKYTMCASIPINECGAKKVDKCNKQCIRVDCIYTNNINKNLTSLQSCLPKDTTHLIWSDRCNNQYNYFSSFSKKIVINECNKNPTSDSYGSQQSKIWNFIKFVIAIFLLIIIGSIIYYRWKLKTTGIAPFQPPAWTPSIMYPRHSVQIQGEDSYRQI